MIWTNDPERDAERYHAMQARWLAGCPVCDACGYHIDDEFLYDDGEGLYHAECLLSKYRKDAEEFRPTEVY